MLMFVKRTNYMRPYLEARISKCEEICPLKGRTCGLPYTRVTEDIADEPVCADSVGTAGEASTPIAERATMVIA